MNAFILFLEKYAPLCPEVRELLSKKLTIRTYRSNDIIRKSGESCQAVYFIRKGIIKAFRCHNKIDWFSSAGEILVPYNRFLANEASSVSYVALDYCELLIMDRTTFDQLAKYHSFLQALEKAVLCRLYRVNKILLDLQTPGEKRLAVFETHFADLTSRLQAKQIAAFLGISPKTILRARLKKMIS